MNAVSPGTLTSYELAGLTADVLALVTDGETATTITYYTRGARSYDPSRGTAGYAETATTCAAHLSPVDLEEVDGARVGDLSVLIAASLLSAAPKVDDRLTIAGVRYSVYAVEDGTLPTHYRAYVRKAA